MPPRAESGPVPIVPQPKTKALALTELLGGLFRRESDRTSSTTSEAAPQAEDPEVTAEWVMIGQIGESFVGGRNYHSIIQKTESEEHRRLPHNSVNAPGLDRSHLEGTAIPQISPQSPESDSRTAVNNNGAFHDSNLFHVNQGDYGTVSQGNTFSVNYNRNVFNVAGGMVQNLNEDGLSGVVPSWISK